MRRIALAFAATVSVVVLLFSYHTSTGSGSGSGPLAVSGQAPLSRPATTSPSSASGPPSTGGGGDGTFTGDAADTRYGPVQVQITVSAGKITAVHVLQAPQESGRDIRINSEAVPILNQEAVQAQSAQVDTVSGATYTSEGYVQSLQSAIDAAHR
jgi:uncharacterized protein with FMN-binding domain